MGVLSVEEALAAEAIELHGDTEETRKLAELANNQKALDKREFLNEDRRARHDRDGADVEPRGDFYVLLNKLNSAALCRSGGGIRSATFCLGVIQALAGYDLDKTAAPQNPVQGAQPAACAPGAEAPNEVKNSALGRFHYLSTVSGGGYVGSWLSSWRHRNDFATVIDNLTGRPNGPDIEPPETSWLRAYSNYLTPQLGITSADSWAAVAICIRNLILNWLVIIPIVCIALLLLKLIATLSVWAAHTVTDSRGHDRDSPGWRAISCRCAGFTNRHRPPRRIPGSMRTKSLS